MNRATWLVLVALTGGTAVGLGAWLLPDHSAELGGGKPLSSVRASPASKQLAGRVDDPRSPAFQEWLFEMKQAQLREDEVLDILDSNLSAAQKNAVLDAHLRERTEAGSFAAPERWNQRLSEAVLRTDWDEELGHKAGNILGHVSTPQQLAELEAEYRRRGPTLGAGNKLAIVTASHNPAFVNSVLDDATEPLAVREAAVDRVAAVGDPQQLKRLAGPDSKAEPTLKVASVGALAENAQSTEQLTEAVDLARTTPEPDAFGRSALNVAQTRASESSVDGKSLVLFEEWKMALSRIDDGPAPEPLLLQALIAGKAFSRALWTEGDRQTAAQLIDGRLAPTIVALLGRTDEPSQPALLQALAEFASDYCQECSTRAPNACSIAGDRRTSYATELATLVRPKLEGSLAFYAHHLRNGQ